MGEANMMPEYYKRPSRPAKEITCKRCGAKFYTKKPGGQPRYCLECGINVYDELRKKRKAGEKAAQ